MKNLTVLVLMLFSMNTFAATVGTVTLQGTIAPTVAIVVTGQGVFNNLDLATTQTNLLVVNVQEQSNVALGYKVTMASQNAGLLKNGTISQITYTARYNAVNVVLSTTPQQVTNQGPQVAVVNVTKPVTISYTGVVPASVMQGTYSDVLTFTITAN